MIGFIPFSKGICPKVNAIARLEYELTYYDSAVHHFNHYTTRTPPTRKMENSKDLGIFFYLLGSTKSLFDWVIISNLVLLYKTSALVPTKSLQLISNEPAQYSNVWPFTNSWYRTKI